MNQRSWCWSPHADSLSAGWFVPTGRSSARKKTLLLMSWQLCLNTNKSKKPVTWMQSCKSPHSGNQLRLGWCGWPPETLRQCRRKKKKLGLECTWREEVVKSSCGGVVPSEPGALYKIMKGTSVCGRRADYSKCYCFHFMLLSTARYFGPRVVCKGGETVIKLLLRHCQLNQAWAHRGRGVPDAIWLWCRNLFKNH